MIRCVCTRRKSTGWVPAAEPLNFLPRAAKKSDGVATPVPDANTMQPKSKGRSRESIFLLTVGCSWVRRGAKRRGEEMAAAYVRWTE